LTIVINRDERAVLSPGLPVLAEAARISIHGGRVATRAELLSRISVDPAVCGGKPCIRGHRIWVSLILDLLSSGMPVEQVLEEYPGLVIDDVLACLAYGAERSSEPFLPLAVGNGR